MFPVPEYFLVKNITTSLSGDATMSEKLGNFDRHVSVHNQVFVFSA